MAAVTDTRDREVAEGLSKTWWWFLVVGIVWVLIALAVLSFDSTSAALIGYWVAFVLLAAGVTELFNAFFEENWRWVSVVFGVLFLIAGILALFEPFQTFGILALLLGWFLVFRGTLSIVMSIAGRGVVDLWGLLLAIGIFEVVIGVWAIGHPYRSAWLLILWVGIAALFRGVSQIILAFQLRLLPRLPQLL
jgi:uncharacterized membrane protein HdeD (DUF308 family)